MKKLITATILFINGVTGLNAQDKKDTLKVGDPAPPIVVRKWIKGKPVTNFKPGMVYAVEFWATWCGPCQEAMPHLSELARKYKGKAEVVSIDVREKNADFIKKVERFVTLAGDRMDYTVAVDAPGNVMHKTWLQASGANGIPAVFVIDRNGKIAWLGHPNFLDDVLEAVVNGQYDKKGKVEIEALMHNKQVRFDSLYKEMMTAWRKNNDYHKALALVDEIMPLYPGRRKDNLQYKYQFLSHIDSVKARRFGEELMAQWDPKDQLNFAFLVLFGEADSSWRPDYGFALELAEKAAANTDPEDKPVAILALAYYRNGNKEKAIHYQKKYIEILERDAMPPEYLEVAQKRLKQYGSLQQ